MRRVFIMRKDLQMSPGKLAAQVGHCAEAYWTRLIKNSETVGIGFYHDSKPQRTIALEIDEGIYTDYLCGIFTKTICEAKNKNQLLKAVAWAEEKGFIKDVDYGLIYDKCLTDLIPEEEDGTTLTGVWFKPLPDDAIHEISKKYQLYR